MQVSIMVPTLCLSSYIEEGKDPMPTIDGLWGHAHTNVELVDAARAQMAELASKTPEA